MGRWFLQRLRCLLRDERGTATIEFVVVFPAFVFVLLAGLESGITLTKKVMLERSLDLAVRDLRLGMFENPTHPLLRDRICQRSVVLGNCSDDLLLELLVVDKADWTLPTQTAPRIDRSEEIAPLTTFNPGGSNQVILVRACMLIDPLFPTTPMGLGLTLDPSVAFALRTASALVNEPR
jgi:Flp pilus assembly pilin Flp